MQSAIASLPADTPITVSADTSYAVSSIGAVTESIGLVPKDTPVTVTALTGSSVDDVMAVSNAIAGVDSKTVYLDVVTRYSTIGTPARATRHGGIPRYAHGGIITELAEAGPELLHFAGGGVMPIVDRGIYAVPPHTYVSPNNTGSTRRDAPLVYIENITVGAGATPADAQGIVDQIVSSLDRAIEHRLRGGGLSA